MYGGACPPPAQLLATSPDTLREAGLSRQKSAYLLAAAQWFALHPEEDFEQMSDEQVIQSLTQIRGVGRWTAEMVLMFTLGRPDVFPTDDLGIRKAMAMHYQLTETGKELVRRMDAIAQGWRPFRSWACFVLWKSLDS